MNLLEVLIKKVDKAQLWSKSITLSRKEYLTVKGTIDTNLYYIVSGSIRIYFEDEYEAQILRLGYAGNFIGALDSFMSSQPTSINIQALKKSEIKVLSKTDFDKYLENDSANLLLWKQVLELLVYQQMEREIDLLTYSPQKRYERVLQRSPQLFQEIPSKYIASYLRMSPETLSRLKKNVHGICRRTKKDKKM